MTTLNRRHFLAGATGTALSFAAAGVSAAPTEAPRKWDRSYDMVIVGAGGGGLMAAHYAAEAGLKAVVLEKLSFAGGSSAVCGGALSIADTPYQREKGIKDSDELFVKEMLKVGKNVNDPELVKAHVKSVKEVFNFIDNVLKVKPKTVTAVSGMSVPRAHSYYPPSNLIEHILDYITKEQKVPVLFSTKVERLVWGKGRVCGVRAVQNGKTVFIEAKKGLLLATGGFQYNKALMVKYNPLMAKVRPQGGAGATGDGLLMAQAYGADVLDTQYIKATFGYQLTEKYPHSVHGYYSGAVIVNHAGKRFVNESISYKLLSDAALAQPDDFTFQLFDEAIRAKRSKESPRNAQVLDTPAMREGKDTDYCFVGQTLEEVAKKAGVDPKGLVETVKQYNADVDAGRDSLFGRTSLTSGFGKMMKIEKPPFFLYPSEPRCIATYCGMKIDVNARVIDVFGDPIPGLYACGECTGGVHGAAYMTGTAIGKAFSFGRLAALDIAKK